MNIKWNTVIIGIIIAFVLNFALSMFAGALGDIIAYLLATIYIGYIVGGDYRKVATIWLKRLERRAAILRGCKSGRKTHFVDPTGTKTS